MSERIIITGATGFIGKALCGLLVEGGYEVVALTRNPDKGREILGGRVEAIRWDGHSAEGWGEYTNGAFAIINLAGESIGAGRWTEGKKDQILQSRLNAGKAVVEAVEQAQHRPRVVIQASGIGIYGDWGDERCDESTAIGSGFLPDVGKQWEESTQRVTDLGIRHVVVRTGVVLGKNEGFLPRILLPFRLFIGGHFGSGRQWLSWIHIHDEVRSIQFLMEKEDAKGVFNLSSPNPLPSKAFSKSLGQVMKRPSWFPVPGFVLKIALGEMARELILSGQRAVPKRLAEAGFEFCFLELETALRDILE